jgi:membrane protein YqaA with SNARE-associated domain
MFSVDSQLWGLFVSAVISSTLLPGGSEIVLGLLHHQGNHSTWLLLIIATLGNTLGGLTSVLIGRAIYLGYSAERLQNQHFHQAIGWLQNHGSPLLLLSWLPVVGDPLCVAAGWLRINIFSALLFIAIGKSLRYTVVLSIT